jgi:hypothetical protein
MSFVRFIRNLANGSYFHCRRFVRFFSSLLILVLLALLFRRSFGIPTFLLDEILRRMNDRGIPVEVDRVLLTLNGWRAENVRYYSKNPDDFTPLLQADELLLKISNRHSVHATGTHWQLDLKTPHIQMAPPLNRSVQIPPKSPSLEINHLSLALLLKPKALDLSRANFDYLGLRFHLQGTVQELAHKKKKAEESKSLLPQKLPFKLEYDQIAKQLESLNLPEGGDLEIKFSLDLSDSEKNTLACSFQAIDPEIKGVRFQKATAEFHYAHSILHLTQARLIRNEGALFLQGEYFLNQSKLWCSLENSITSKDLLDWLPSSTQKLLEEQGFAFEELPKCSLKTTTATPKNLLQDLSGSFSMPDLKYKNLQVRSLQGDLLYKKGYLLLKNIRTQVISQPENASKTGSSMEGGWVTGSVFWDHPNRCFGVQAKGRMDPNLLLQPLAPVHIATKIIQMFRLKAEAPEIQIALGAKIDDWKTFFLNIQAEATNLSFRNVPFETLQVDVDYKKKLLNIHSLQAHRKDQKMAGTVAIDFAADTAQFDVKGIWPPKELEQLIYPKLQLFGKQIQFLGDAHLKAKGIFDWGHMQKTDFSGEVVSRKLLLPLAEFTHFSSEIYGKGSVISLINTRFGYFGGKGGGSFSLIWEPQKETLPYELTLSFAGVNFHDYVAFFSKDSEAKISGTMSGNINTRADFSTNFFATATGIGFVRVENGQLTDLPFFKEFSHLMRKLIPSFTVFTIKSLRGSFFITDGKVITKDAHFGGDLISAKGVGSYAPEEGFDATIQVKLMNESRISKILQTITNPVTKLLTLRLTGSLGAPSWSLDKFTRKRKPHSESSQTKHRALDATPNPKD